MPRVKQNWWQHKPTIKLRLRAYNAQSARYRKPAIELADLERAIAKCSPALLSKCCYCKRTLLKRGPSGISFDHTKSLARGGESSLDNLRFSCRTCNRLKGAWNPDFFTELVALIQRWDMWGEYCSQMRRKWGRR